MKLINYVEYKHSYAHALEPKTKVESDKLSCKCSTQASKIH